MKKLSLVNLILLILNIFMLLTIFPQGMAAPAPSLSNVVPFATSGGYVGFFDQNDGTVYIYDGFLKDCALISRIEKLGEPMVKIK